ncbi:MAG: Cytochrome b5 reductase 4, variant 2 [Marteilia pararefringens]
MIFFAENSSESFVDRSINYKTPPIVYDVTQYLDFHPGTKKILMDHAGTNATTAFNAHHPYVNFDNVLYPFRIGKLQAK